MEKMDHDPPESTPTTVPRQSDRPPVGEPLVVSRRNPQALPTIPDRRHDAADAAAAAEPVEPVEVSVPVEPGELDGRVALVTHATGTLGSALVGDLVSRGAGVLLLDADLSSLNAAVEDLGEGARAVPLRCDLSSQTDVASVCDFVTRAVTVDLVMHVAGLSVGDVDDPVVRFDRLVRSEIRGPVELVEGIAGSLGENASVVVVDSVEESEQLSDGARRAVRDLVRDRLSGTVGVRFADASCGPGVEPGVFAGALVDLMRDDVPLGRIVLDSGRIHA